METRNREVYGTGMLASIDNGEIEHGARSWLIAMGIAMALLGCIALASSMMATLMSVFFVGGVLVLAALFQGVYAFTSGHWRGFASHMLYAVLYAVGGIFLIGNPLMGAASITLLLGFMFLASGLAKIIGSLALRFNSWGWTLLSGIVTAFLGAMVVYYFPMASIFLLGTLVGVDLLFSGINMMVLGFALKPTEVTSSERRTVHA